MLFGFYIVWSKNILEAIASCWLMLKCNESYWKVAQEHGVAQYSSI